MFWNSVHDDLQGHSKVVDFDTKGKRVWDFLLVLNSNLGPCRVSEILELLYAKSHLFHTRHYSGYDTEKIAACCWGLQTANVRLTNGEITFKEFKPMWSNPPKLHTDRQTDRQTTFPQLYGATHVRDSRDKTMPMFLVCTWMTRGLGFRFPGVDGRGYDYQWHISSADSDNVPSMKLRDPKGQTRDPNTLIEPNIAKTAGDAI